MNQNEVITFDVKILQASSIIYSTESELVNLGAFLALEYSTIRKFVLEITDEVYQIISIASTFWLKYLLSRIVSNSPQ